MLFRVLKSCVFIIFSEVEEEEEDETEADENTPLNNTDKVHHPHLNITPTPSQKVDPPPSCRVEGHQY